MSLEQVLLHGICACLAETEVVLVRASTVRVPLDVKIPIGSALPCALRELIQPGLRLVVQGVPVKGKMDGIVGQGHCIEHLPAGGLSFGGGL